MEATLQRLRRWNLRLHNVVADAGYGSGEKYAQLESRGLMGYIPPRGGYKEQRPSFTTPTVTSVARASASPLTGAS